MIETKTHALIQALLFDATNMTRCTLKPSYESTLQNIKTVLDNIPKEYIIQCLGKLAGFFNIAV